jgi:3-deoxy-manno-octulosonate cytidylyltransferase (CMP-KDO synthetase)
MIQHVFERTSRARLVNEVIVATDDGRVASTVHSFGGKAVMTPESLRSGTDRVAFAARSLQNADLIINVQGDEPLIVPDMIDEAVRPLIEDDRIVVGTLVRKIESEAELASPTVVKVVLNINGDCLYFSRSTIPFVRDHPSTDWLPSHTFYKHIGVYVFRKEFLNNYAQLQQTPLEITENLEQLRILEHGYRIRATVTWHDSTPVDTQQDLDRVRTILQARP